eukprot:3623751-Amphidinium_carterae.1
MLGYHSRPDERMVVTYGRDNYMSAPLRELGALLSHIREGRFFPDETRSGMWRCPEESEHTPTEQADSDGEESVAVSASPTLVLHTKSNRYHKKDSSRFARLVCGRPTVSG